MNIPLDGKYMGKCMGKYFQNNNHLKMSGVEKTAGIFNSCRQLCLRSRNLLMSRRSIAAWLTGDADADQNKHPIPFGRWKMDENGLSIVDLPTKYDDFFTLQSVSLPEALILGT